VTPLLRACRAMTGVMHAVSEAECPHAAEAMHDSGSTAGTQRKCMLQCDLTLAAETWAREPVL